MEFGPRKKGGIKMGGGRERRNMDNFNINPALLETFQQFISTQGSTADQNPDKLPGGMELMLAQMLQSSVPTMANMTEQSRSSAETIGTDDADSIRVDSPESETGTGSGNDDRAAREASLTRPYRVEPWYECFATTSQKEFEALIYSLYVIGKNNGKLDGYEYYECINRLQNKCRYKVRCKVKDEFFIVEEKGGHNHAIEPVGQAGSHAGLPKTLREIVDKSFNEDWPANIRQEKVVEEVKRLGLPPNPRLSRQIDNRIAYLRRVKNLQETKKIQDQIEPQDMGPFTGQPFMQQMGIDLNVSPIKQQEMMTDDDDDIAHRRILEIMQASAGLNGMGQQSEGSQATTESMESNDGI
ncbi:hypothetical protein WR25_21392 [Diploscapter pachys]|uniref:FLYWCH-type domain-containing protein n=1 Tax=Diploscapter pachys TaxID=2018661 RepID=A0A2A2JCM6_9BILA|nr:hypothetical protein WR25_21392 [Diploscapter pachys]